MLIKYESEFNIDHYFNMIFHNIISTNISGIKCKLALLQTIQMQVILVIQIVFRLVQHFDTFNN